MPLSELPGTFDPGGQLEAYASCLLNVALPFKSLRSVSFFFFFLKEINTFIQVKTFIMLENISYLFLFSFYFHSSKYIKVSTNILGNITGLALILINKYDLSSCTAY